MQQPRTPAPAQLIVCACGVLVTLAAMLPVAAQPNRHVSATVVADDRLTWIEAEDFAPGGEGVGYHDNEPANLGGAARPDESVDLEAGGSGTAGTPNVGYTRAGEWLAYPLAVLTPGVYTVRLRASRAAAFDATVTLHLADATVPVTVSRTDGWHDYRAFDAQFTLPRGNHVLRLVFDDEGVNLDGFALIPPSDPDADPQQPFGDARGLPITVAARGVTRIEAERFDLGGEGVAYHEATPDERPGDANDLRPDATTELTRGGTGVTVGFIEPGEWWEYTVFAERDGNVAALLSYARGDAGESAVQLIVNGTSVGLSLPSTGGWHTFREAAAALPLVAGENVLRIQALAPGQFNLDRLDLVAAPTHGNDGLPWTVDADPLTLVASNYDEDPATNPAVANRPRPSAVSLTAQPRTYTLRVTRPGYHAFTFTGTTPSTGTVHATVAGHAFDAPMTRDGDAVTVNVPLPAGLHEFAVTGQRVTLTGIAIARADVVQPVHIGDGSYASEVPPVALERVGDLFDRVYAKAYDWIDQPRIDGQPQALPTNDWWSHLLEAPFAGGLSPYPLRLTSEARGLTIANITAVGGDENTIRVTQQHSLRLLPPQGADFTRDALVDFGDWTVRFRLETDTPNRHLDITTGRGLPCVWVESAGVPVRLDLGTDATIAGDHDAVLVTLGDVHFGLFATDAHFQHDGNVLTVHRADTLTIAALPDAEPATLAAFASLAPNRPTDSRFDFAYNADAATVTTTWTLTTNTGGEVFQGWLPHHLDATGPPQGLTPWAFPSIRGPVTLAQGNAFTITRRAANVPVAWPMPNGNALDRDRMRDYLDRFADDMIRHDDGPTYGNNSYWGGKDPQRYAAFALIAEQLNDDALAGEYWAALQTTMEDWLTYSPGEPGQFFARYPDQGALIGFMPDFGAQNYTDNHFHAGYFTTAAGVLALHDPDWADRFGEMAGLVARHYANPDRDDPRFPYLRTFEPWVGHSYAGGMGDARGNNQESTSEAIQAWLGLTLLGAATGDDRLLACGVMGYTLESAATATYWFNASPTPVWPDNYQRSNVGILYDDSSGYATFFGANPEYILGIQALPLWPALGFLGHDADASVTALLRCFNSRGQSVDTIDADAFAGMEGDGPNDWLNVLLGYHLHAHPAEAAAIMDELLARGSPSLHKPDAGLYWFAAHAQAALGRPDATRRLTTPLGAVYTNDQGTTACVTYNATTTPQRVRLLNIAGDTLATFDAPPGLHTHRVASP